MEPEYTSMIAEMEKCIMNSFGIPPHLLEGNNYSSSRVALEVFENRLRMPCEPISGGSWIGNEQSP